MTVQPYEIKIAQSTLDDLKKRLARTRWMDEPEGAGWNYGTNLAYLKELADYWQHRPARSGVGGAARVVAVARS